MASLSLRQLIQVGFALGGRSLWAAAIYPLRRRRYEAQREPGRAGQGRWQGIRAMLRRRHAAPPAAKTLGQVLFSQVTGQRVDLECSHGILHLEVLADDLICFWLQPTAGADRSTVSRPFSYALDPEAHWPAVRFDLEESAEALTVVTRQMTCRVDKSPCRLTFLDAQGQTLSEGADGFGFQGEGAFLICCLAEEEAFYGLGEKTFGLNLRGRVLALWNADPDVYLPGDDPVHLCIPMLIGLREGRAYGYFFDNPGRARLDLGQNRPDGPVLGQNRPDQFRYESETGGLCAYFIGGATLPAVLERYTQLTGRMPMPPRWMLGYQQSRWSYSPERRVRELAAEFRRRRIPCDALYLDIHYMDGYRIFTWDQDRFPDPSQLIAELRQQGFRVVTIIDPGVKVDSGYTVHDEGLGRDAFCRLPDGTLFRGPVWPGECFFPDFTDPQVRAWWGELYRPLVEAGVAGFWNDMNEPAIFAGAMPGNVVHHYEGQRAAHREIQNVYGLQMARASAEGLRRLCPDRRVPVISRSGYAGLQRFALVWTGDNQSSWAHLRLGVSMCLNLGLSGIALCGPDVGGFAGDCEGELLARWTQVGALTPFFRNHSALGTRSQEPWAFGEPYESICRRWIEFRYELLPYLYTTAWQAAQTGLPMMRPLALAFPEDRRTHGMDDQFLLGDALLAAPVASAGERSRPVYLPGGAWYDFWTGERLSGEVTANAPLERMPLYVRAGSVLPLGPVLQHTGEWPPKALRLHIYPGDGESQLYEDDGETLAYRSGEFCLTRFLCQTEGNRLRVRREVEGRFEPGYERFEVSLHGLDRAPGQVLVDGQSVEVIYDPETKSARWTVGPWITLETL
jgi:alpha-glucosidase